jgi:ABC-type antimicrobial peptide transport system permease subunit
MLVRDTHWDTKSFALYGALLGLVGGMTLNLFDAFWGQVSDDHQATPALFKMVIFVLAGASLLAAISATRNRLLRCG